mmetsp:Transcript_35042/g.93463  ORF Transcript_35042/g.93463 Transcript_35042/m.93463 type:complete len:208 (-) Transcript_35042:119-742(-)
MVDAGSSTHPIEGQLEPPPVRLAVFLLYSTKQQGQEQGVSRQELPPLPRRHQQRVQRAHRMEVDEDLQGRSRQRDHIIRRRRLRRRRFEKLEHNGASRSPLQQQFLPRFPDVEEGPVLLEFPHTVLTVPFSYSWKRHLCQWHVQHPLAASTRGVLQQRSIVERPKLVPKSLQRRALRPRTSIWARALSWQVRLHRFRSPHCLEAPHQ